MKSAFVAASLFLTVAAVPALAADNAATCRTLGSQTNTALSAASGDVSKAQDEANAGMAACNFGLWAKGAEHYRKALSLLGK
jgi:hypothetical protein